MVTLCDKVCLPATPPGDPEQLQAKIFSLRLFLTDIQWKAKVKYFY